MSTLFALPHYVVSLDAGHLLYEAGSKDLPCYVLAEGSATRFKLRSDGSRAIIAFELSGDIINHEGLLLGRVDCGATISAPSTVAVIEYAVMVQARELDRRLDTALWRYALIKAAALEEWLLNVNWRSPTGRLAHLFLELYFRLIAVGASTEYALKIHVSSQDLADAMGLRHVIVTRSLHELSSERAITLTKDAIVLSNLNRLASIGEFRPDYLHMAS